MHAKLFSTGGFVAHGIVGLTPRGKISAWYGPDNTLLDAEHFARVRRSVRKGGPTWHALQARAALYRAAAQP